MSLGKDVANAGFGRDLFNWTGSQFSKFFILELQLQLLKTVCMSVTLNSYIFACNKSYRLSCYLKDS